MKENSMVLGDYYPICSLEQWRADREADEEQLERKQEALRLEAEKYVNDPDEPATILMSLVDDGLSFGVAQSIYKRRFGADANLQDAAEREAQ